MWNIDGSKGDTHAQNPYNIHHQFATLVKVSGPDWDKSEWRLRYITIYFHLYHIANVIVSHMAHNSSLKTESNERKWNLFALNTI